MQEREQENTMIFNARSYTSKFQLIPCFNIDLKELKDSAIFASRRRKGALHSNAPYFIILLCLIPDDFTRQEESASAQWVSPRV